MSNFNLYPPRNYFEEGVMDFNRGRNMHPNFRSEFKREAEEVLSTPKATEWHRGWDLASWATYAQYELAYGGASLNLDGRLTRL